MNRGISNHQAPGRSTRGTRPNRRTLKIAVCLAVGCGCLVWPASSQYSIDWHKIAGGGGGSTNSQYSVNGTVGQPDADLTMTNGQFSVTGGFWALPQAAQTEGAPPLTIAPASPGFATISWPTNTPGFVLQETVSLSVPNWTNSATGSTNPVTIQTAIPAKFFRLHKP